MVALEKTVEVRVRGSCEATFLLSDFADLAHRTQVGRVLRKLVDNGVLIRVGQGVYVRAKVSSLTQKRIPEQDLRSIALVVLKKQGVRVLPTEYERAYREGRSTQVPTGLQIGVDRRVTRKIGFNGRYVSYERVFPKKKTPA